MAGFNVLSTIHSAFAVSDLSELLSCLMSSSASRSLCVMLANPSLWKP